MTIKYGFELEMFRLTNDENRVVTFPYPSDPKDGFPGLIELRSRGGNTIEEAASQIVKEYFSLKDAGQVTPHIPAYKFTGQQMAYLRKHFHFEKRNLEVLNLYGKAPRRSGNVTLAALQINMSNLLRGTYTEKDVTVPASYGLLDIPNIVKRLDKEFYSIIKETGRQPGMYSIKDGYRLEYRSLPNVVWELDNTTALTKLLSRIKRAVEPGESDDN